MYTEELVQLIFINFYKRYNVFRITLNLTIYPVPLSNQLLAEAENRSHRETKSTQLFSFNVEIYFNSIKMRTIPNKIVHVQSIYIITRK